MLYAEVLLTLAEVAVAFAGFASIAIAFLRRDRDVWDATDAFRYRSMLANSLFACAFALLPPILAEFGLGDGALWATCSALLFAYYAYRVAANVPAAYRLARRRGDPLPRDFALNVANGVIVMLLQLGNVAGAPFARGPAPYVLGVALVLANAGTNFFKLVAVPKPTID